MYYTERFNAISHLIGALLALCGTVFLVLKADTAYKLVAVSVYAGSLMLLYTGSTLYHSIPAVRFKKILQKIDHLAIYVLIAGSYTPFALITLKGAWGYGLFVGIWLLALVGMAQEFINRDPKRRLALFIYLLMGWLALVAIKPLAAKLALGGLVWLVLGGVFYSAGVYWFVNDERIKHGHGIWHIFVLAGSLSHFVAIYFWVL